MKPPTTSRMALLFIFATILIEMIGFGIIIPVMPDLIMHLTGEGLDDAARYGGWLLSLYGLMQFLCAPIIGNLSDSYGRRPVLLLSLFAFAVNYVLMGLAPTIGWLFVGRVLAGGTGATLSTANAYIADITPREKRAQNFGMIGAAIGLGFVLGPVVGGILGEYGPRVPFFAAAALACLNLLLGTLALPETLSSEKRRVFSIRRANPVGALLQVKRYPLVLSLLFVLLLYQIAHDANPSTWAFYTMEKFGWSVREVGYSLGFVGIMFAIVQGSLIRIIIPRLGYKRTVLLGFLLMATGFLGFAFATSGWMIYVFIIPFALGGVAPPALRGIISNQVPDNAQGELQGAMTSIVSFTAIVTPLFMTQLFSYFASPSAPLYFPGAAFLAAAILLVASVLQFSRIASGIAIQGAK